jgi:O-antigen ligase
VYLSRSALARASYVALILINLATLVILANRAGWLAALVVLLIMASFEKRWRWPLLLSLSASAAVLWLLRDSISQSYLIKERLTAQAPIVYRTHAWQVAIVLWKRSPIVGLGYYSFPWIGLREGFFPRLKVFYVPSTENAFLDVLTSAGALGLATFLGVFVGILRDLMQVYVKMTDGRDRSVAYAMIASMAAYAITGFFTNLTPALFIQRLFFFLMGAILGSLQPILSLRRQ